MRAPTPVITYELKTVLRAVKPGRCLDTLPERLAAAKARSARSMGHAEFLELILSDEIPRRGTSSALRAKSAELDPAMALESRDDATNVSFDQAVWADLESRADDRPPEGLSSECACHLSSECACHLTLRIGGSRLRRLQDRCCNLEPGAPHLGTGAQQRLRDHHRRDAVGD